MSKKRTIPRSIVYITREDVKPIIDSFKARFFTITFIKNNGERRKMNGKRFVKGKKNGKSPLRKGDKPFLFTMYETNRDYPQHRTANCNTCLQINDNNTIYFVTEPDMIEGK